MDKTQIRNLAMSRDDLNKLRGILPDNINKAIRRAMEETGLNRKYINTTEHAVRKLYATERFQEELERLHDERKAWEVVQQELGHGERFRENLFWAYIKI